MMAETNALEAFRSTAPLYDTLFDAEARTAREAPFFRDLLERAPGRRVADLACGTGFHARLLAEERADVDAFDLSAEMVAHAAKERPHPNIRYAQGDMRTPAEGAWDLILCVGNSLCLLPSKDDVSAMFRQVATRLRRGGLFLIQVLNYAQGAARSPRHTVHSKRCEGVEITAVKSLVPRGECTLLALSFLVQRREDRHTVSETAVLLHLDLDTLRAMALEAGLVVDAICGGYDGTPFDTAVSSDLIVVFRRE